MITRREKEVKRKSMFQTYKKNVYSGPRPEREFKVSRSLQFSRLFQEVKKDKNYMKSLESLPRRVRRIRMLDLARKTMKMMRQEAA